MGNFGDLFFFALSIHQKNYLLNFLLNETREFNFNARSAKKEREGVTISGKMNVTKQ